MTAGIKRMKVNTPPCFHDFSPTTHRSGHPWYAHPVLELLYAVGPGLNCTHHIPDSVHTNMPA